MLYLIVFGLWVLKTRARVGGAANVACRCFDLGSCFVVIGFFSEKLMVRCRSEFKTPRDREEKGLSPSEAESLSLSS